MDRGKRFPRPPLKQYMCFQREHAEFKEELLFLKKMWLLTGALGMKKKVGFPLS
jgi:hypothetical protein